MALYFGGTALLLHGDGTDGSTTFTDVVGNTVTKFGNAQISTAQSKFGGASMLFDGAGDYLTVPNSPEFNFGTGDFTIEAFIRPNTFSGDRAIVTMFSAWAGEVGFYFGTRGGSPNILIFRAGNSVPILLNGNTALATESWVHVAVSRLAGVTKMFVDGVTQTATHTGSVGISSASVLGVGAGTQSFDENFNGYIDELRITRGFAVYTADFTPPAAPLAQIFADQVAIQPHTTFGPPLSHYNPAVGAPVLHDKPTDLTDQLPFGVPNTPIVNNVNPWEFKGRGHITGTVKNTPATPVRRLLRLYREPGGLLVNSIWSDPDTGAYTFNNLHMGYRYTVVSFDHTQAFRAVVADRVIPEVTP